MATLLHAANCGVLHLSHEDRCARTTYLFSKMARAFWRVQNLVVEHREVEGQAQADWVRGGKLKESYVLQVTCLSDREWESPRNNISKIHPTQWSSGGLGRTVTFQTGERMGLLDRAWIEQARQVAERQWRKRATTVTLRCYVDQMSVNKLPRASRGDADYVKLHPCPEAAGSSCPIARETLCMLLATCQRDCLPLPK
jgi:hypothetical protein